MPTEYDDAFFDVRLCLTSIFWRIYTSNHRWLLGVYYNFKDTIPGCLTDHENKIPVDLQEFPVDILSAYFNTIYTQLMRFFPWHRGENRLNILRCVVSIAANCTAPWNFQQTRQNSSRIPGFPVEKNQVDFSRISRSVRHPVYGDTSINESPVAEARWDSCHLINSNITAVLKSLWHWGQNWTLLSHLLPTKFTLFIRLSELVKTSPPATTESCLRLLRKFLLCVAITEANQYILTSTQVRQWRTYSRHSTN